MNDQWSGKTLFSERRTKFDECNRSSTKREPAPTAVPVIVVVMSAPNTPVPWVPGSQTWR